MGKNNLPEKRVHKNPEYLMDKLARVVSNANYDGQRTVEVMFLDHGKSFPVWAVGHLERKPERDDLIIVGFIEGRKDSPYVKGFVKLESATSNYIVVTKDAIRLQLPLDETDANQHMTDDFRKDTRAYIEINNNGIALYHPTGNIYLRTPKGTTQQLTS
jgi:hypothetical protein